MLITQQLATAAAKNPGGTALHYLGKDITYQTLRTSVARLSYLYQHELVAAAGAAPRVAFIARNAPAFVTTLFALSNIRALCILLDPDLPPEELAGCLKETRATHVAVTSDLLPQTRDLLRLNRFNLPIIEIERKQGGEYDTSFTPPSENPPADGDPILLIRSSGSTGKHRYLTFTHKQISQAGACLRAPYHLLPTDRFHTQLSWAHPFALTHSLLLPLFTGATAVIDHGLENAELLDYLGESRVTRLIATPAVSLKFLITCKNFKRTLKGVKSITVGLGQLQPELVQAYKMLKVGVAHCYGQAENLWSIAMADAERPEENPSERQEEKPRLGKPLGGHKYKVLDPQGDPLEGDSRVGLLAVTGPTIMTGYMGLEKETKSALRGTWLYTGDIARLQGEGEELSITFLGRREDLLRVDGEFVSMNEVTPSLRRIPGVLDAAAFILKNSRNEDVIACALVRANGFALNEKQVLEYCKGRISPSLAPTVALFTEVIPKDAGGNPVAARLRAQFSGAAG